MRVTNRVLLPLVVVVALAISDWAARQWRQTAARPAAATSSALRMLDRPVPVPPFTVTDLDGHEVSPAAWRGRFALVNVWATWCAPCRQEIPDLVALQRTHPDTVQVVGVLADEVSADFARRFARTMEMNYPVVLSTWSIEAAFGETLVLPTSYLIAPDGLIVGTHIGPIDVEAISTLIETR